MRRTGLIAIAIAIAALTAPSVAAAEDPPGCTGSGLNTSFEPSSGLSIIHRNGDELEIAVRVTNATPGACTYVNTTVTVQLPQPNGTLGPEIVVATGQTFPGGMAPVTLPTTVPYEVDLNPGIFSAPVRINQSGTGRFPGGDAQSGGSTTTNVVISRPHVSISVTPTPDIGAAPLAVNYQYSATNDTPVDPAQPMTTPAVVAATNDTSVLADDSCSPVVYTGGDTTVTTPPLLQEGETWTFMCQALFETPGTFTSNVSVVGNSTRDGRPWPPSTAQSTVTVTGSDVAVAKSHQGDFVAGGSGAYSITVRNAGNQPTSEPVTVTDQLPAGLEATSLGGAGWNCTLATLTCTRSDVLGEGAAYPSLRLEVDAAQGAAGTVTNRAAVAGGGEPAAADANNEAADPTTIQPPNNGFTIGKVARSRDGGVKVTVSVPGPGRVTGDDAGAKNLLKPAATTANRAGDVKLRIRPAKAAKKRLKRGKAVRAKARIGFMPDGGELRTQSRKLKLKKPKRR